jgi:HK97 family phage portal protein
MALFQVRERPADPRRESRALQFLELPLIGATIQAQRDLGAGDVDSALRDAAVWKCTDLISSMISVMTPQGYRGPDIGVGAADRVARPPAIIDQPAASSDIMDWMYQVQISTLLRGNAFGEIVGRGPFGRPTQIELQHPDKVRVRENSQGEIEYKFGGRDVDPHDVWHAPSYRMAGMHVGMSPIAYQQATLRGKLAAQTFGNGWFDGGGHPTGVITNDGQKLVDQTEADTIKKRFMTAVKGHAREPVVMGGGWKYTQIQINPEESQFLATMKYGGGQICGIYRVPPELVGESSEGSSITYANVESRGLDFLTFTMMRWVRRWEGWLDALTPPGQYVKLDMNVLLRTDALTRWRVHHMGVGMEAIAPSEIRTFEDLPPLTPEQQAEIAALKPIPPVIDTPQAGS